MPTLTLTATLPCSADVAWSLLTDPARMNTWSSAHVTLTEPGAGDDAAGVGALRRITLPHGRISFLEVVEGSVPPHLLRYRVFRAGPLLRHHRGEQRITATAGGGCRIDWTVDVDLVVPLLGRGMVAYLRREVRSSLDAMRRIAEELDLGRTAAKPAVVERRHPTPERLDALTAAARRSLAEQRAVADELAAADDPKQWFARVYQYVTEEMIAHALDPDSALRLENPDWVLALIPVFHEYFITNLDDYRHGREPESAWQRAWSICEREDPENPALPIMKGLLAGVSAHIEADLPRAIARVQAAEFPDRDLREFRPDYLALAPIFHTASARLLDDLPGSYQPWWVTPVRRLHPNFLDAAISRTGYDVARHRLRAFDEAVRLWNGSTVVRPTESPRRTPPRSSR
ncbi:SRPBCC family protein [Gordonia phthalatica]|uniref:Polyketide cyclase n=1 Tax=Gordonia phthalatica TaxID=1136941 RepID=A0A0N9MLH7_9ACTN|nr:SRPBCC family protein [Gordonia phthalatica]ALG83272.1 hypothetical protein ACH46_00555 [Gordonia phthalatica]